MQRLPATLNKLTDVSSPAASHVAMLTAICWGASSIFFLLQRTATHFGLDIATRAAGFDMSFLGLLVVIVLAPLLKSLVVLLAVSLSYRLLVRTFQIPRLMAVSLIMLEMFVVGVITHSANWSGIPAGIAFGILSLPILGGVEIGQYREGVLRSLLAHMLHNAFLVAVYAAGVLASGRVSVSLLQNSWPA